MHCCTTECRRFCREMFRLDACAKKQSKCQVHTRWPFLLRRPAPCCPCAALAPAAPSAPSALPAPAPSCAGPAATAAAAPPGAPLAPQTPRAAGAASGGRPGLAGVAPHAPRGAGDAPATAPPAPPLSGVPHALVPAPPAPPVATGGELDTATVLSAPPPPPGSGPEGALRPSAASAAYDGPARCAGGLLASWCAVAVARAGASANALATSVWPACESQRRRHQKDSPKQRIDVIGNSRLQVSSTRAH